jgi:hypothetical protein
MGGGSLSFAGWTIPANLDTTDNGIYTISQEGDASDVEITGTPHGTTGFTWTIVATITPNEVISVYTPN